MVNGPCCQRQNIPPAINRFSERDVLPPSRCARQVPLHGPKSRQVTGKVRLGAPAKQFVKKESRRVEQDVRPEEVVELVRDGPEVLLARCRNPASPEERSSDQ